jgi:hypothetical protein
LGRSSPGNFKYGNEPAISPATKINHAVHPPRQLPHDIESYAAATMARVPDQGLAAKLPTIARKAAAIVTHTDTQTIPFHVLDFNIDMSGAAVSHGIVDQIRQHAFQCPRISGHNSIAGLGDFQIGPVMSQGVNSIAEFYRFEEKLSALQVNEKQRILQLQLQSQRVTQ